MAQIMAFYCGGEVTIYEDGDKRRPIVGYLAYNMATGERLEAVRAAHTEQSDVAFRTNLELWKKFQAEAKPSLMRTMSTTGWTGSAAQFYCWARDRGTPLASVGGLAM